MGITRVVLPDTEVVAALVHLELIQDMRNHGSESHLEEGEEIMVPYHQLSENGKATARQMVTMVYAAIQAAAS